MRKQVLYLSIYAALGITAWTVFGYLNGQRTLVDDAKDKYDHWQTLNKIENGKAYRWQDAKGEWHYGEEKPNYDEDYKKQKAELEVLKQLPEKALPTGKMPEPETTPSPTITELIRDSAAVSQLQQGAKAIKEAFGVSTPDNVAEQNANKTTNGVAK